MGSQGYLYPEATVPLGLTPCYDGLSYDPTYNDPTVPVGTTLALGGLEENNQRRLRVEQEVDTQEEESEEFHRRMVLQPRLEPLFLDPITQLAETRELALGRAQDLTNFAMNATEEEEHEHRFQTYENLEGTGLDGERYTREHKTLQDEEGTVVHIITYGIGGEGDKRRETKNQTQRIFPNSDETPEWEKEFSANVKDPNMFDERWLNNSPFVTVAGLGAAAGEERKLFGEQREYSEKLGK